MSLTSGLGDLSKVFPRYGCQNASFICDVVGVAGVGGPRYSNVAQFNASSVRAKLRPNQKCFLISALDSLVKGRDLPIPTAIVDLGVCSIAIEYVQRKGLGAPAEKVWVINVAAAAEHTLCFQNDGGQIGNACSQISSSGWMESVVASHGDPLEDVAE